MAAKRPSALDAMKLVAVSAGKPAAAKGKPKAKADPQEMVTTGLHIRRDHLSLLRRAAVSRADAQGGRSSVSAVLGDLIERHRAELERLANQ